MRYSVRGGEVQGGSALVQIGTRALMPGALVEAKELQWSMGSPWRWYWSTQIWWRKKLTPHTPSGWSDGKDRWPVYALLSSGRVYGCDFVVSATGVIPGGELFKSVLKVDSDGGVVVDEVMRTSKERVYAAGDLASPGWNLAPHWLPMRLWTQARQTGMQAAVAMVADAREEEVTQDFCFEMFAHVTKFFGFKVVLLGLFNGQKLDRQYDILL